MTFSLLEVTIGDIQIAFEGREISARELVRLYLKRIEAFDRDGPRINSIITVAPGALKEADRLDAAFRRSGAVGPLRRALAFTWTTAFNAGPAWS